MENNCPQCGTVMCGKFDERQGPNGITLTTPNGKFSCMKCGYDPENVCLTCGQAIISNEHRCPDESPEDDSWSGGFAPNH